MDILIFETRDKTRIDIQHGEITSSTSDAVRPGDRFLRVQHASGFTQVILSPEQWGRLVDSLAATIQRVKH